MPHGALCGSTVAFCTVPVLLYRIPERNERRMTKKIIKKILDISLAIVLAAALAACGSKPAAKDAAGDSAAAQSTAAQTAAAPGDSSDRADGSAGENNSQTAAGAGQDSSAESVEIPETPYAREDGGVSIDVFAMDTYMNLLAYGDHAEEAVVAAAEEIHRIDDMLSTGNPESEISMLNAAGTGAVSEDTLRLIEESQTLYKETGGLFDIAIYPVMKLWGFPTQEYRVPTAEEIKTALKTADPSKITIGGAAVPAQTAAADRNTASKTAEAAAEGSTGSGQAAEQTAGAPAETAAAAAAEGTTAAGQAAEETPKTQVTLGIPGMEIDLGGIAKGFTSSRVMEVFKEHGVKHGLVSLGGNVQALGAKENGKAWRVAIQNPESELDYLGVLDIEDKCVITSGGYERFFEKDGVRYHHIIDPRTGFPADSGIISATIISNDGTLADGLSTSLFIMGKDEAEKYWRKNADKFDYILEDKDGKLYVTEGAADLLTTEAETEIVKK